MNILYTKSNLPLSKAIRDVTGEPVSHCVLEFPLLGIIIQSNLLGINIEWAEYFKKSVEVVYSLKRKDPKSDQDDIDKSLIGELLVKYEGSFYDVKALLFVGVCLLLKHYLKMPLPKNNLWQTTGMFMCTEWVTEYLNNSEDSMITPYKHYLKLKQSGDWLDDLSS